MVRPKVSVCNQRHINILHATAISQLFQGKDIDTLQFRNNQEKEAVFYMFNLLRSLNNLKKALVPPVKQSQTKGKSSNHLGDEQMDDVSFNGNDPSSRGPSYEETHHPELDPDSRGPSHEEPYPTESESLMRNWSALSEELTLRPLITTLLPGRHLTQLGSVQDEFLVACRKMSLNCDFTPEQLTSYLHADFFR